MTSHPHLDPARVIEEVFYTFLHRLFHDEGARSHFGFAHINPFSCPDGLPGWNLWFDDCAGAYQMALAKAEYGRSRSEEPSEWIAGRWVVKYFPPANEAALDEFSTIETLARLGPLFDATGTTTPAGREQLDEDLFIVGYVDVRIGRDRNYMEMTGVSQNRWREIRPEGLYLDTEEKPPVEVVAPGDIDRNVPGWALTFFFYDKLLCGLCHAYRSVPDFTLAGKRPGTQLEISGTRQVRRIPDMEAEGRLVCVGLPLASPPYGEDDDPCRASAARDNALRRLRVEDWYFSMAAVDSQRPTFVKINPQWWSIWNRTFKIPHGAEGHLCCYRNH